MLNTEGKSERGRFSKFSKASQSHRRIGSLPKYHGTTGPRTGFWENSSLLGYSPSQADSSPLRTGTGLCFGKVEGALCFLPYLCVVYWLCWSSSGLLGQL